MAVTIQDIAERAGVSRGTVDRALNQRGRVNPEVADRVLRLADEMGYVPKHRKYETKKENLRLGIVTQLSKSSFMLEVNRGIHKAMAELAEMGIQVLLRESVSVDEQEQLAMIDELTAEGIQGLALMPVDCEGVREKINELTEEKKIPVVTFNSDIVGTKRNCFVGMDNKRSGQTAAGLMGMLTGGVGKIMVITGFFSSNVNNSRVDGFVGELKKSFPGLEAAGVQCSFDDDREVEKIIKSAMQSIPGINGLFLVSAGQKGIERAFRSLELERRPYTIIYDLTPENTDLLERGMADFLIDQDEYVQGYEPLHILADLILKKKEIQDEYRYTDINIKTKYNI
ncbi:MAG: LacI family DNA-binding transcriptional regulator [Clostridiales bacterium]|nr:LacI family DNA-binding transcriptional regulator [Clostridiales bacterium]